jgi:hypothetical protein
MFEDEIDIMWSQYRLYLPPTKSTILINTFRNTFKCQILTWLLCEGKAKQLIKTELSTQETRGVIMETALSAALHDG